MYMNQIWIKPYLGGYLMAQFNIDRQLAQDPPGTLHAGIDLALEKNVVVVINENGERQTISVFHKTGEVMTTSCGDWKACARSTKPPKWW